MPPNNSNLIKTFKIFIPSFNYCTPDYYPFFRTYFWPSKSNFKWDSIRLLYFFIISFFSQRKGGVGFFPYEVLTRPAGMVVGHGCEALSHGNHSSRYMYQQRLSERALGPSNERNVLHPSMHPRCFFIFYFCLQHALCSGFLPCARVSCPPSIRCTRVIYNLGHQKVNPPGPGAAHGVWCDSCSRAAVTWLHNSLS